MGPPRRKTWTLAGSIGVIAFLGGAFSTWAATDRKLAVHIATAGERVRMMCNLAEYQIRSTERQCEALHVACPRPPDLLPEILARTCTE